MNYDQFVSAALRTEKKLATPLERYRHGVLGLRTEIGEFSSALKRCAIYGAKLDVPRKPGEPTPRVNMLEELGDIPWYASVIVDVLGVPLRSNGSFRKGDPRLHNLKEFTAEGLDEAQVAEEAERSCVSGLWALSDHMSIHEGLLTQNTWMVGGVPTQLAQSVYEIMSCVEACVTLLGSDMDEVTDGVIAKLRARFPDAYTDEAAEARADKGGLGSHES